MNIKKILLLLFLSNYFLHAACEEKKLVVFITGYNNAAWVEKTLDSVLMQQYQNFRILYIDDASSDGTPDIIHNYIKNHAISDRFTFIQNKTRRRKLANLYHGFYMCDNDEIIVFIDGDDWLIHNMVFNRIIQEYQDPTTWMTYGSYCNVPKEQADQWRVQRNGSCNYIPEDIFRKKLYRKHTFIFMHLRTCYAWLLKQIKLKDLIARNIAGFIGDFYPASNDLAVFFPVVEMAHGHVRYIKELLYVRNLYSHLVGFKVDRKIQVASAFEIRKKKSYPTCKKPMKRNLEQYKSAHADIIIAVTDTSIDVKKTLTHIQKNITGYNHIFILYDRNTVEKKYIRSFADKKNNIIPLGYDSCLKHNFQETLNIILEHMKNNYILLINPALEPAAIDCSKYIYWLEHTKVTATTNNTENMSKKIELDEGIWATLSHFDYNSYYACITKKENIKKVFSSVKKDMVFICI